MKSNFEFLSCNWPDLARIGREAEAEVRSDPGACAAQLGAAAERIVSAAAAYERVSLPESAESAGRLEALRREELLPRNVGDILDSLLHARGADPQQAGILLKLTFRLCTWFMQVYGDWNFVPAEYAEPDGSAAPSGEEKAQTAAGEREPVRTAASDAPQEQRRQKAREAAEKLPLSEEELRFLRNGRVRLEISMLSVVNYALQQNGVPVVQSAAVVNRSDRALENVELKISAVPELCLPFARYIDCIPADSTFNVGGVSLLLNGEFLAGLTEKVTGLIRVSLDQNGTPLWSGDFEVTALAFDEWHGSTFYPELLAAFVTPNHPEIVRLNARAADLLEKWTGDPSLDAYQTRDPNRVLAQAGAIYGALQEQNIVYAVPPASFERIGQRVRLCDAVLSQKMGTCLDLTLLYASCLEAAGLHPLLILKSGHIFSGVWLEDLTFPEAVGDDASLVTKRLASGVNEIAATECTLFVAGRHASFDDARAAAEQELLGENAVEYVIDVNRARLSGVSPLPQRVRTPDGWRVERGPADEKDITGAPKDLAEPVAVSEAPEAGAATKKAQWERRLLDLGLRNALINMRLSKAMVPILTSSLDKLEDALSDGGDFSVLPRPEGWHPGEKEPDFETMHDLGGCAQVIESEFKNRRLRSAFGEAELSRAVKELYRSARTALEENGANTLYLAMGLLRWYETARSTRARYAPVILLPVEMVRKSAAQGYVLRLRDDEPQENITMLEKLRQDFGITAAGLDPLPQDEHGIDTRKVFTILRKAVMGQPRWDVLESAYLGIFSFSQFVMWNDIRNRSDDLAKNKIVRSLMDGRLAWNAEDMAIGKKVPEDSVFLPIPADASQLYAIEAACKGESFVLHGPPGTGKSQTITALIANALAQGKTVLFVAEKMAALEVVQKRLADIGIGPFCLELHSNKSRKKDVLEQLRQATEVTKSTTAAEYGKKAAEISALRKELDSYAASLHKTLPCGMTLFELVNRYEEARSAPDIGAFSPELAGRLTAEQLSRQEVLVGRLTAAGREVGHPHAHPLEAVGCTQYSQQLRNALPSLLAGYRSALETLSQRSGALAPELGVSAGSYGELQKLAAVSAELEIWLSLPRAWAAEENPDGSLRETGELCAHFLAADRLRRELSAAWTDGFFALDGRKLGEEYRAVCAKWFLAKALGLGNLGKRMAAYARSAVPKDALGAYFEKLEEYQREKSAAEALLEKRRDGLGPLYRGEETDWQQIADDARRAGESAARLRAVSGTDRTRREFAAVAELSEPVRAMNAAWDAAQKAKQELYRLLAAADDGAKGDWIPGQLAFCGAVSAHAGELKEWITWNAIAEEAVQAGLLPVVEAYRGGLGHDDVQGAYRKAVFQALAGNAIDADPALGRFSGAVFNEKIEQFRRVDRELTVLTRQEIFCLLASKVPDFAKEAAQSSELGILQRAIRSGGWGMSIRRLFEQIPNLLPRLCPCMLMSPISAAQYLEPNREPFSLVVFDEASQLPTCKAVGALARGENAVIVGDPKQMPPTSFFASSTVDEDNLELEDLESILDDCLALNMPQTHLLWHYRSRHESLIAFSNSEFYENRLLTFPSVNDRESKVSLVRVNGVFDRGKTRQNRAEAETVVNELKRRCHDGALSQMSVGVVTFNISQQNLIDDLLTEACQADPELEAWAYHSQEPVFIKNLENVQGDERDVILFSIGYGPDADGKVYMNFGPLNLEGGWRRLNVAITRARCEMTVYSSLTPDQIDLTKTSAKGVAALREFLSYAQGRGLPQTENAPQQAGPGREGVAETICAELARKGYRTQRSVGRSEFRIDVGVVDPDNPGSYLLGILLDGADYRDSRTTRDREIAQTGVLTGLGWHILRVWTMDWWDNRGKELGRICSALEQLRKEPRAPEQSGAPAAPAPRKAEPDSARNDLQPQRIAGAVPAPAQSPAAAADPEVYRPAALSGRFVSPEDFLLPQLSREIETRVGEVIVREAPVGEELLTRRVVQSFGIARAGSRIQLRMSEIYREMGLRSTAQEGQRFFWKDGQDPDSYEGFRASGAGDARRDARDVPVQEAANAVCRVLKEQVSLSGDDLVREAAKLLGYTRSGSAVTAMISSAVRYGSEKGRIAAGANGHWILREK